MKGTKRGLSFLLGLLIVFSVFPAYGFIGFGSATSSSYSSMGAGSSTTAKLHFDQSSYTVYRDHTFNVTVVLNSSVKLGSLQFNVTWDPEYLEFVSYSNGSVDAMRQINDKNVANGYLKAALISLSGLSSGDVLVITFRAKEKGTTNLTINIEDATDTTSNPVDVVSGTSEVVVKNPVVAGFTFSPTEPAVGQEVTFDASDSKAFIGSIMEYEWNFGDNESTTTTTPVVTHRYLKPGNYSVTLTVIGTEGNDSITKQIEVINHEPSVTLTCEVVNETLGKVKCTATATDKDLQYKVDQITKYVWDFGDGDRAENETSNTTVTVEHTYTKGGNYIIKVTVFDKFDANASANTTISVSPIKTKEIPYNETHDFRKEIHVDYSSLSLNYTSGFQYVNETAFNYIKTFVIPNVTNTSNKYLDSLIKEYLANVIKEERGTPSWEVIDIKKEITNGNMNVTINWTRTSEIIGYNKTTPSDRLRLIIKEERTIYVSFSFPPIREQNAPVINIMSPTETIYNITTIPIKVNITDESNVTNITAFLDGVKIKLLYNLTSGLYENTTIVFTNGSHVLKVYARDEYGNLNMTRVYFVAHEGLKVEQKGNVTVGILGNVTNNVTLVNNTVVANVSVNGTIVPVEVPVETTNNVLINVSAIEEVLSAGPGNASVVATWNASASKPKVIAGKNKLEVSMNLTMGQNTTMLIAIKLKYGIRVNVTLYKRNGTVYTLTKDKNNKIGYYYIVDKVLFVALKKDPDELVISDKAPAQNVLVPSYLSYLMMLDYVYYHNFIKYNATYSELYKKVLGAGVDNETLQKAEKLHEMAVEEYKKAVSISGGVALNSSDPRVFIHLRKAYIYIREAVKLLVKIVPEE